MSDPGAFRGSSAAERWFDHVVRAVTVVAIVGGFAGFSVLQSSMAVLQSQNEAMQQRLDDFRAFMSDRYTANDARRDHVIIEKELEDHEQRIRSLEGKRDRP